MESMRVFQKGKKRAGLLEGLRVDSMELRLVERRENQMAGKWATMTVVWKGKRMVESKAG